MLRLLSSKIVAVAIVIITLWLPFIFQDTEGFPDPLVCLLMATGIAIVVVILSWKSRFRQSSLWFALLMIAQGLLLQLIDAGPSIHYQHYRLMQGFSDYSIIDTVFVLILLLQTVLVLFAFRGRLKIVISWLQNNFGLPGILILITAVVAISAFPSRELPVYVTELFISGFLSLIQLANLLLVVMLLPREYINAWSAWLQKVISGDENKEGFFGGRVDYLAVACAVWVTVIAIVLVVFSYERHPHIADEVGYLFNAKYFANGMLSAPVPPVPDALEAFLIDCDATRCISPMPPGWPAILSVGSYFDVAWLVNPLLSGINILLSFVLLRIIYNRWTARLGVLLLSVSPWYLFMSMNFMTHTFSLTSGLVAAICVSLMVIKKKRIWGIHGGIALGILSLTRPLEALMVASILGLVVLFIDRKLRLGSIFILIVSTATVASLVFPYNKVMTGKSLEFPVMAYMNKVLGPGANNLGFGADKGADWGGIDPFPGHGAGDVVVNAILNVDAMNVELFGWSTGSLILILMLLLSRSSLLRDPVNRWMLLFIGIVFGFQSLYWFSGGPDFGARYYYLLIIPLVALTAQSIQFVDHSLNGKPYHLPQGSALLVVFIISAVSLVNFIPWRAIDKYHNYRDMRPDIRTIIANNDMKNALLIINGKSDPDLISAIVYADIDPYGPGPVVAWNRNKTVMQKLLQAYPDRNVWVIDGPSVTGSAYKIISGPVLASDLAKMNAE